MNDIKKEIKQKTFSDVKQETVISLLFTSQRLRALLEELCKLQHITLPQYNILRILKGIYPEAHPRAEIRKRMIDKSDVTRLIDRLEEAGLVKRIGAKADNRHSLSVITPKGLKVIENLEAPFEQAHNQLMANLNEAEMKNLVSLLKKITI